MRNAKPQPSRKAVGYFNEDKLLKFAAELNNERNAKYVDLCACLEAEYEDKMPEGLLPYKDLNAKDLIDILDGENKVQVMLTMERFKKYHSNTWMGRILTWLAR